MTHNESMKSARVDAQDTDAGQPPSASTVPAEVASRYFPGAHFVAVAEWPKVRVGARYRLDRVEKTPDCCLLEFKRRFWPHRAKPIQLLVKDADRIMMADQGYALTKKIDAYEEWLAKHNPEAYANWLDARREGVPPKLSL